MVARATSPEINVSLLPTPLPTVSITSCSPGGASGTHTTAGWPRLVGTVGAPASA